MPGGSYIRFGVGLILSIVVLLSFISGEKTSLISMFLALIFIVLSVLWAVFRF